MKDSGEINGEIRSFSSDSSDSNSSKSKSARIIELTSLLGNKRI